MAASVRKWFLAGNGSTSHLLNKKAGVEAPAILLNHAEYKTKY